MKITIPYSPMPHQAEMHKDPTRFRFITGGRRAGKSVSCFQDMLIHCLNTPGAMAWWVAPTYAEAREIGYEEFKKYFEVLSPAVAAVHHSAMRVEFKNGSKMYFKGADRKDSLRGRGLTFLVIDEAAFVPEEVWRKILRPALSDKHGRAILISTPNGKNWFFDQYQQANPPSRKSWKTYFWPSSINPLMTPEEIEAVREELSDSDFRQEFMAEYLTKAGQVYDDFSDLNVIDEFTLNLHTHDLYVGIDFGFANPSAACFMAVNKQTDEVIQFAEVYRERMKMEDFLTEINDTLHRFGASPRDVHTIYTDPAGNASEITSGVSPVDFLRKTYTVLNRGTLIAPGLVLVRKFIKNANGRRKFFVYNQCTFTIKSFNGYTYKHKQNTAEINEEPDKDGIHDHMCDAVRYFFVNRFDNAKYVAKEPLLTPYYTKEYSGIILKRCLTCRKPFSSKTEKHLPPFKCKECSDNE